MSHKVSKKLRKAMRQAVATMEDRDIPQHRTFMSGIQNAHLTGAERVEKETARYAGIFTKEYPRTTKTTDDEGNEVTVTMHFVGMQKDIVVSNNVIRMGVRPTFATIEETFDFEKAEKDIKERTFAGNFIPMRVVPYSKSKYQPHQGKKECARRIKQGLAA